MAAANTDKARKKVSLFQTTLNGAINGTDTSLTLNDATNLPTDTAVTLVINRVDANGTATTASMEVVTGVVSGSDITNLVRAEDNTSAKSHANGSVVEVVWDAATWNDFVDAYLTEHKQDGTHDFSGLSAKTTPVNADSMPITDSEDSNELKKVTIANLAAALAGGWTAYSAVTPTRASADDPTYVLTFAAVDLTSTLSVGMKVKFTQNSATVYGIITAISFSTNTTVTLYCGTDYDVLDTASYAISSFNYSAVRAPFGFPLDPDKWTVEVTDDTVRTQSGVDDETTTIYNLGTLNIIVPIGAWDVSAMVPVTFSTTGRDFLEGIISLSSSASAISGYPETKRHFYLRASASASYGLVNKSNYHVQIQKTVSSKTTIHLVEASNYSDANMDITLNSSDALGNTKTIIRAVCAYL